MSKTFNTDNLLLNNSLADFLNNPESFAELNLNQNSRNRQLNIQSNSGSNSQLQILNLKHNNNSNIIETPQFIEKSSQQQQGNYQPEFIDIEIQEKDQIIEQVQPPNLLNLHNSNDNNIINNLQYNSNNNSQDQVNNSENEEPHRKQQNQKVLQYFQKACELQKKMNIINNIQKFMNQMISRLNQRRFQQLDDDHFGIISDKTYFLTDTKQHNILIRKALLQGKKITSYFSFILRIPMFQPSSLLLVISESLLFLVLIFHIGVFPLNISFNLNLNDYYQYIQLISYTLFSIKILISLNTGFFEDGIIILDRKTIIKRYLTTQFFIDLLSIIAVYMENKWLNAVYLLQVTFLQKIMDRLDEFFLLQQRFSIACQLIKLLLLIFTVGHFCACGFCFITQFADSSEQTWLTKQDIQLDDWNIQYLFALYYSFITMTTIGYGDITPVTIREKIYVIIMTQIACGIFAYAINTIGQIFQEIANREAKFKYVKFYFFKQVYIQQKRQAKSEITSYMQQRNISKTLQFKVLKYLQYSYNTESQGRQPQKGEQVLNTISQNIRQEVYQEFFGSILMSSKLFGNNFSQKFLLKLSLQMKEMTLSPGEDLFKRGDQGNKLYYIIKGTLEEYIEIGANDKEIVLGQINGEFICITNFFTGCNHLLSTRSKNIVHLVYINYDDFVNQIKLFPVDNEKFCMIKERYILRSMHSVRLCQSCNKSGHSVLFCPLLSYQPDKDLIIKKNNFSQNQKRSINIQRQQKRSKYNSVKNSVNNRNQLIKIRNNLILEFSKQTYPQLPFIDIQPENDKDFFVNTPLIKQGEEGQYEVMSEDSVYSDFDMQENTTVMNNEGLILDDEELQQKFIGSYTSIKSLENLDQSQIQNIQQIDTLMKENSPVKLVSKTNVIENSINILKKTQLKNIMKQEIQKCQQNKNNSNNMLLIEQKINKKLDDLNKRFSSQLDTNNNNRFITQQEMDELDTFDRMCNFTYFMPHNNFSNIFKKERKKTNVKRNAQKFMVKNQNRNNARKSVFPNSQKFRNNSKRKLYNIPQNQEENTTTMH